MSSAFFDEGINIRRIPSENGEAWFNNFVKKFDSLLE
jgi:hypothetical protein